MQNKMWRKLKNILHVFSVLHLSPEHLTNVCSLYLAEMTMIRRWSKPKSFSGGGTQRHPDDPDGPISRCTILEVDVSCVNFIVLHIKKLLNVDVWVHFPDGSEPGCTVETEEWNESGSSTEAETQGIELFWLDYQADSGDITSFIVHKVGHTFVSVIFLCLFFFLWY